MLKKKIFFTLSKYVTFGLKFLQSLYIARYLGPEGFAIYGFAQLISLYISFLHFGIPLSIHAMLSTAKDVVAVKVNTYISDGFTFLVLAGIVFCIIGSGIVYLTPSLFEKFHFAKYGIISIIIGINLIIIQFFSNIYQVYAEYIRIALNELISVALLFVVVFYFKDNEEDLLYNTLLTSALMIFINIIFFLYKAPFKINFSLRKNVLKDLIKQGVPLLISTVGFYLITISIRSISSYYFSLEQVGLFTFALNISNSVMMGLNAISWTFYSTILANTCDDIEEAYAYVQKVNRIYNFVLIVTIFIGILCLPILFYFLPAYKEFSAGVSILLISQICISISMGYNSLLVAQKKQNYLAIISFITLTFAILLSVTLCLLHLPIIFQPIVVMLAMFVYTLQNFYIAAEVCKKNNLEVFFSVFDAKVIASFLLLLMIILIGDRYLLLLIPIVIFVAITYKEWVFMIRLWKNYKYTK